MHMNAELEAIKDAMAPHDPEEGHEGQDRALGEQLSDAYVAAHPEEFTDFADKTIVDVVKSVDVFREAGMEDMQWRAEAWHLHKWHPQTIGGVMGPQEREVEHATAVAQLRDHVES